MKEFEQKNLSGNRIKEARLKLGLSQAQLAERLGVTLRAFGNWERGDTLINVENLIKLSTLLNLSSDYILGISDFTHPENEFITKQLGISDDAANTLCYFGQHPNDTETQVFNFITSDSSFIRFIHELSDYLKSNYNVALAEVVDDGTITYKALQRPNGKIENRILLGKESPKYPEQFDVICLSSDIVSTYALQEMEAQLVRWKDAFKNMYSDSNV